jgi:hypothetical protein
MRAASGKVGFGCLDPESDRARLISSNPSFANDTEGFFRVHFDCSTSSVDRPVLTNQAAV